MPFGLRTYAVRNIIHRPVRSAALSLGIAALAGSLFFMSAMYMSVTQSVERAAARLGADAVAVASGWHSPPGGILLSGIATTDYLGPDVVQKIRESGYVSEAAEQLFIVSASLQCCSLANTVLVGFNPELDFTVSPWIGEHLNRQIGNDEIVVGSSILSDPGGMIRFFDKLFRVAAKIEPTGMPIIDGAVFIPMDGAREMIASSPDVHMDINEGDVTAVLLKFPEGVDFSEAAVMIEYQVPEVTVVLAAQAMRAAREDLLSPLRVLAVMMPVGWAVSLFLIGVLYWATLDQRRGELALLRAMGAGRRHLLRMFTSEVLTLSATGAILGIFMAWASFGLTGFLFPSGSLSLSPLYLGYLGAASFIISVVAALAATAYPLLRIVAFQTKGA